MLTWHVDSCLNSDLSFYLSNCSTKVRELNLLHHFTHNWSEKGWRYSFPMSVRAKGTHSQTELVLSLPTQFPMLIISNIYMYIYIARERVEKEIQRERDLTDFNPSRVILCQEVRESRSLYVHIYIFGVVISKEFFFLCTQSWEKEKERDWDRGREMLMLQMFHIYFCLEWE